MYKNIRCTTFLHLPSPFPLEYKYPKKIKKEINAIFISFSSTEKEGNKGKEILSFSNRRALSLFVFFYHKNLILKEKKNRDEKR